MSLPPRVFAPSPSHSHSDRPLRRAILLVEDEPFVRQATSSILEQAGFEVFSTSDAQEAAKVYQDCKRRIDLVMTDLVLPGRSGEQLGRDLQERSPDVVVLVTSGYDNPEYEKEAADSRTYFLAKPYSSKTLVEKIEKILAPPKLARAATQAS
ncbi:MAG: response regulator [Terriglobales bacterium]